MSSRKEQLGVVAHFYNPSTWQVRLLPLNHQWLIPALGTLRQGNLKFEASLGYVVKLKNKYERILDIILNYSSIIFLIIDLSNWWFFNYRVLVFTDKLIVIVFSLNMKYVFEF